ncbi:hypothetical protein NE850_30675 [Paraburkholderia sp. USG1]|uniref:hypothetical protein n=1 Tax=Paraburkholderia sp. USG1 TaxID=2952268 RepID=UPI0028583B55|nr:hypothetical protein [Paraburkholderia sp. USG1]MDR8400687.1 hypothetical protein [Paraburkholderia sp. USG1]
MKDNIVGSLKEMHDAYDPYRATIGTGKGQEVFADVLRKSAVWESIRASADRSRTDSSRHRQP